MSSAGFYFFSERPRSPMAARGAIHAGRGTSPSMERDAGSHSVDRIVGLVISRCQIGAESLSQGQQQE
jgi:hypothetical protein